MDNSTRDDRIELALADLRQQKKPNIRSIAKKCSLLESTLRRRWYGKTMSYSAAASEHGQRLTNAQEETLIKQINRLIDREMPLTSSIIRNFAEEMIYGPVGKNWTGDFIRRNKDKLTSLYLRNIDSQRIKTEYPSVFKYFYTLVGFDFLILLLKYKIKLTFLSS
jgi:transposase-like protein